jgi:hypothetical protein
MPACCGRATVQGRHLRGCAGLLLQRAPHHLVPGGHHPQLLLLALAPVPDEHHQWRPLVCLWPGERLLQQYATFSCSSPHRFAGGLVSYKPPTPGLVEHECCGAFVTTCCCRACATTAVSPIDPHGCVVCPWCAAGHQGLVCVYTQRHRRCLQPSLHHILPHISPHLAQRRGSQQCRGRQRPHTEPSGPQLVLAAPPEQAHTSSRCSRCSSRASPRPG